ncbi:tyrosine-type recombinase/integrase [Aquisalimonas lutea]|uniref:tyrosine-type recombinase/integrase n=1 Tax=Aquisalimonas lutea TaxID=1327750 RepID=UPI0025B52559|nr:site-specific integrase [Aquisalimonas lutea]MDN3518996.1 tyrosine-type recombinase/integrase [Aquisalimonas lutea]
MPLAGLEGSSPEAIADHTLRDVWDVYRKERILRPATIASYDQVVRRFEDDVGPIPLGTISRDHLFAWRSTVLERATPITWNTYRRTFRALWRYAIQLGWVEHYPLDRVGAAPVGKRRKKTVNQDLLARVLTVLSDDQSQRLQPRWFWRIVVLTFYYTGMRLRQLVNLRWQDVDWKRGAITLTQEGSKTRREWEIPLPPALAKELQVLWYETAKIVGHRRFGRRQVFDLGLHRGNTGYKPGELTWQQVNGYFRRLSNYMDEPISPHRLRHTCATEIARQPQPNIRALQHLLGHTSLSMTMEYIQPDLKQMYELVSHLPTPGEQQ